MKKFNLEKFKNGKQRIKCDSQEEYDAVCEFLAKQGFDKVSRKAFDDRYKFVGWDGVVQCWSHACEVEIVTFDEVTVKNMEIGTDFSQQFGEYVVEWHFNSTYLSAGFSTFSIWSKEEDRESLLTAVHFNSKHWQSQLEKANQILELYNIPLVLVEPNPKTKRVKIVSTGEIVTVEEVAEQGMYGMLYKAVSKENTYIRVRDCVDYNPIQIKKGSKPTKLSDEYSIYKYIGGRVYLVDNTTNTLIADVVVEHAEKLIFDITGTDVELIG